MFDMHGELENTGNVAKATRKEWIGLAVLALPTLLLSLDLSVLYLAVPELSADLKPGGTQLLWIMDIYGFMIAGFLVTMGTLGDRIGRRKLLLIGGAAFSVASVFVAFSQSPEMLIVSRAFLGIAGATLMPSTLALISNMFRDAGERSTAIAVWLSCFAGGTAIGPLIGGAMLEYFWWGSVFLLGVPVMLVLLVLGPILLPEHRDATAGRLDLLSVLLSLGTILPVVYGIKELAKESLEPGSFVAIAVGLAVFVRRQRTLRSPMIDVSLFRNRVFSTALGFMLIGTVTMGGMFFMVAQYLQLVAGFSPFRAGLAMVPSAIAVVVSSMMVTVFTRRFNVRAVLAGGFVISAVGGVMLSQVDASGSMALLIAGNVITALGMGPLGALCTDLVVSSAPPERAGSASAMSETSAELGTSLGVALLGSLAAFVYRNRIEDALPSGLAEADTDASRESLSGAVTTASGLQDSLASQLVDSAREAFTTGLNVVSGVGAVGVLLFALVSLVTLRGTGQDRDNDGAPASVSGAVAPATD
jgi:DHA2 family multidrug resistance protein-like MFS transporter